MIRQIPREIDAAGEVGIELKSVEKRDEQHHRSSVALKFCSTVQPAVFVISLDGSPGTVSDNEFFEQPPENVHDALLEIDPFKPVLSDELAVQLVI